MKKIFLFTVLSLVLFSACKPELKKGYEDNYRKNTYIKDNFFGAEFGSDKSTFIERINKAGFVVREDHSNDSSLLICHGEARDRYHYMGYRWGFKDMMAYFKDGKLYAIEFSSDYATLDDADKVYQVRKEDFQKRYFLNPQPTKCDKQSIEHVCTSSVNGVSAHLHLFKCTTLDGEEAYCVALFFISKD